MCDVKNGINLHANDRFIRYWWEISLNNNDFDWYAKSSNESKWYHPLLHKVYWGKKRHAEKFIIAKGWTLSYAIYSRDFFKKDGVSYTIIGHAPKAGLRKKAIFDMSASTAFHRKNKNEDLLISINSAYGQYVCAALNPTVNFQKSDLERVPIFELSENERKTVKEIVDLQIEFMSTKENLNNFSYEDIDYSKIEIQIINKNEKIEKSIKERLFPELIFDNELLGYGFLTDFPHWDGQKELIPEDFTESYQEEESLLALSRKYRLHPDSLLQIKEELGLIHEGQRKDDAFKNLSWAIGVLLGRFDAQTGGLLDLAVQRRKEQNITPDPEAPQGHDHGLLYLSALDDHEGLHREEQSNVGTACLQTLKTILQYKWGDEKSTELWGEIENALVLDCRTDWTSAQRSKKNLNTWIRTAAFGMHSSIYQKRPIYFPLISAKKSFFLWVNIHQWNEGTLNSILANYLNPDISLMENRIRRLREERHSVKESRQLNAMEKEIVYLDKLLDELKAFTAKVSQLSTRGPAPEIQEIEAPYVMDLDDGVMVNSSALWELVWPLWKDPKKWWTSLSAPKGKKDFDWSHLAMRYWPSRVMEKVKKDPSLAVAHSDYGKYKGRDLFEELHPEAAKKWHEQQNKQNKKQLELDF